MAKYHSALSHFIILELSGQYYIKLSTMKHFLIFVILISMSISMQGQSFNRAELDTPLNTPW